MIEKEAFANLLFMKYENAQLQEEIDLHEYTQSVQPLVYSPNQSLDNEANRLNEEIINLQSQYDEIVMRLHHDKINVDPNILNFMKYFYSQKTNMRQVQLKERIKDFEKKIHQLKVENEQLSQENENLASSIKILEEDLSNEKFEEEAENEV